MADSAAKEASTNRISRALVDFSVDGAYPDEQVSSLQVGPDALPPAIEALARAKVQIKAEIHAITEETADDVKTWQANAQSVQDDIVRSKAMAKDILKTAEAPAISGIAVREAEEKAAFLVMELNYNRQLRQALADIKAVGRTLDEVELARDERRILDALRLLEKSWKELDAVSLTRSCRALKILNVRAFELKSDVREALAQVWNALIHVDVKNHRVSISTTQQSESMGLGDAVKGLKAYKEFDRQTKQLWHDIDRAIVGPRMNISSDSHPGIHIESDTLLARGTSDKSIGSLFVDLERIFAFLVQRLPPDLVSSMSSTIIPQTVSRITTTWLDSAVPSSLRDMDAFQGVIAAAKSFCDAMQALGLSNTEDLEAWVANVHKEWLSKCKAAALDSIRVLLSQGLGTPKEVERTEKQMVSRLEGRELSADDGGWDTEWAHGEPESEKNKPTQAEGGRDTGIHTPATGGDDGADAWGWGDDEDGTQQEGGEAGAEKLTTADAADEEDPSEAWGWGDDRKNQNDDGNDEKTAQPAVGSSATHSSKPLDKKRAGTQHHETRELVLKEMYHISAMPQPILDLIFAILEDGAALMGEDGSYAGNPVVAAGSGLFTLPALALAMFRAVSSYYYSLDLGGSMYLYNDATYLAERLADFASAWKQRGDISTRAQNMLRLDNDVKSLQSFAARAYTREMNIQKTVVRDLLGGEESLMQQEDDDASVTAAAARIRSMATVWEGILARSAWQQAVGSLCDAAAVKVIGSVLEMTSIGQDEAYRLAGLIAVITELDDLFLPSRYLTAPSSAAAPPFSRYRQKGRKGTAGEGADEKDQEEDQEVPTTAQFAASWLRLKFLSEVLQSNLRDVRFLWMESDLSLYFSADEVVDLVNMSFEDNARTREVVREITHNPRPPGEGA